MGWGEIGVDLRDVKGMGMVVGLLSCASNGSWFHVPSLHNLFSFNFLSFHQIAEPCWLLVKPPS